MFYIHSISFFQFISYKFLKRVLPLLPTRLLVLYLKLSLSSMEFPQFFYFYVTLIHNSHQVKFIPSFAFLPSCLNSLTNPTLWEIQNALECNSIHPIATTFWWLYISHALTGPPLLYFYSYQVFLSRTSSLLP